MSTHNIGFYEDLTKIIFELSSNTHLIFSAGMLQSVFLETLKTGFLMTQLNPFSSDFHCIDSFFDSV